METIKFATKRPAPDAPPEASRIHHTLDDKRRADPNRKPIEKVPLKRQGGHHD